MLPPAHVATVAHRAGLADQRLDIGRQGRQPDLLLPHRAVGPFPLVAGCQWLGQCPGCNAWNSYVERSAPPKKRAAAPEGSGFAPVPVSEAAAVDTPRLATGFEGVDRVLGGGVEVNGVKSGPEGEEEIANMGGAFPSGGVELRYEHLFMIYFIPAAVHVPNTT